MDAAIAEKLKRRLAGVLSRDEVITALPVPIEKLPMAMEEPVRVCVYESCCVSM